jgi:NTE family protein
MTIRRAFALLTPLLLAGFGHAQAQTARPKVALVLSGGGAYGLLYLGALEWLEEHRIPIDAIAGTSGGALVGGWYATGLQLLTDDEILHPQPARSADELRLHGVASVLEKIDFEHLFDSQPDYRNLSMLQKRERRRYPNDVFGGLSPSRTLRREGLVPGQTVGFLLDWIGRDYPLSTEALPIPFRAVAVDAADPDPEKWRTVVLGGPQPEIPLGLSRAIRASISVPILFTPVEAGRHRLIDGAVRNNLPTDVAIDAFQPDALIALRFDNGNGPDPYRQGRSSRPPRNKVVVTFNPGEYRVDQFALWREFAWLGYHQMDELTGTQRKALDALALSPLEYLAYRRRRLVPPPNHTPTRVEGDAKGLEGVARAVVGKSLDDLHTTQALGAALDRLVADEGLATAGYDLRQEGSDTVLYVRTTKPKGGPPYVRLGLDVEASSGDRPWFGLRKRISSLGPNQTAYWLDLEAGNEPSASGGLDVPIKGRLSLIPSFRLDRDIQFDFRNGSRDGAVAISTAEGRIGLAYRPSRASELSAGLLAGANGATDRHGHLVDRETGAYRGAFAEVELDSTDDPVVPRKGSRVVLRAIQYYDLDRPISQLSGSAETYFGPMRDSWGLRATFGTSFGADPPFPYEYRLGGLGSLDAYRRDEIRSSGFAALALTQTHAIAPLPFALGRVFTLARVENAWANGQNWPGASFGLLADTRGGTGYLGVGLAERGAVRFLLGLGRRF